MVPSLIHLALAAAIAGHAAAADPPDLATAFTAALVADDLRALHALAVSGRAGASFFRVVDILDGRDRIAIASQRVVGAEWDDGVLLVHLELDGVGDDVWHGRETVPLPRRWTLQAVPTDQGWRLRGAATDDQWLASRLAAADAATIEEAVRRHPYIDRRALLRALADEASNAGDAGGPAIAWVIAQARADGDLATEALALRQLVHVDLISGRAAAALPRAAQALALAERAGDPWVLGQARFAKGIAHWFNGDIPAAVDLLAASADNLKGQENPRNGLRGLYMAAHLELSVGRLRQALALMDRQEQELRRFPWPAGELSLAFERSTLHGALDNNEVALPLAQRAYALAEALGDTRSQALALLDQAYAAQVLGMAGARELLEAAARIARTPPAQVPELGHILNELAHARARYGDVAGAEATYLEAVELARRAAEPGMESEALSGLGALRLRQRRFADALRLAQDAVARALAPPVPSAETASAWPAHTLLGRALHALGRDDEAVHAFRLAILEVEQTRGQLDADALSRARFLDQRLAPYRELLALLVAKGAARDALLVSEQTKARALEDALSRGSVDLSPQLSEEEKTQERALEGALIELNRRRLQSAMAGEAPADLRAHLAAARGDLDRFRSEAYLRHPQLAVRRMPDLDPLDVAAAAMPAGGAVLEFTVLDEEIVAILVRREGSAAIADLRRLGITRGDLEGKVARLVAALESRDPEFTDPARELYDLLIAPFAVGLHDVHTLAVIPDGALWRVPFEVLPDARHEPLVARLALFRAPALRLLAARPAALDATKETPRLLALGDPDLAAATRASAAAFERGFTLGPLPDAVREVREIGGLYGASHSDVRIGAAAQERVVKEAGDAFDVLHLATHGLLDDRAPMYSALALAAPAGTAGEDGLLEAREIADLHLGARLAVLSACETGRGRVGGGEGVIGLSWAFLAAGVPTLVVSDRNAPSEATARLMVELHRQLLAGRSPAESLRRAELALRSDPRFDHPYYWSPFVVVGAGW